MTWLTFKLFVFSPLVAWAGGLGIAGAALLALWWFSPAWLHAQIRHLLFVGAFVCFGGAAFFTMAFNLGQEHGFKRIAALDEAAVARVLEGREEVDGCNGGLDWDTTTGSCHPGLGRERGLE